MEIAPVVDAVGVCRVRERVQGEQNPTVGQTPGTELPQDPAMAAGARPSPLQPAAHPDSLSVASQDSISTLLARMNAGCGAPRTRSPDLGWAAPRWTLFKASAHSES